MMGFAMLSPSYEFGIVEKVVVQRSPKVPSAGAEFPAQSAG